MMNKGRPLVLLIVIILLSPLFAFAITYPDGALIRAEGELKVYLIEKNRKDWIKSPEEFNARKFDWQKIRVTSKEEVAGIKDKAEPSPSSDSGSPVISPPPTAKINSNLIAPDYIRADWLISHATAHYGQVGQKITFKYSEKTADKIENFRLYEKKPGDRYFYKVADFEEIPSTGCEDIDIDGEWMMTEAGQCGYWAIQRIVLPARLLDGQGGRGMTAYRPAADYSEGEYSYYVAGVDKDGLETRPSLETKLVFLPAVSIFEPSAGRSTGSFPNFRWSIAAGWPSFAEASKGKPVIDYFVMFSDNQNDQSPVWTKQLKMMAGQSEKSFIYDGAGLSPSKKYQLYIYGHFRQSEYEPDFISIPLSVPEFAVKLPVSSLLWQFIKALFLHPLAF